jgi:PIN domain nuclease of toxin-antitoxin system
MAYLLDTHTFLWFVAGDKKLPTSLKQIIKDITKPCFISVASFWEIAIKKQIGKLTIEISLDELYRFAERNQIEIIPVKEEHLITLLDLELLHNDPFDRLILSQTLVEGLVLLSRDKAIKKYEVKQRWA